MTEIFTLLWVLGIDLALSLDNAAVIAAVVTTLPEEDRGIARMFGIGAAVVLRILCAVFAAHLMHFAILTLLGALFLFHVAAKLACEQLEVEYSLGAWLGKVGIKWPFERSKSVPAGVKDAVIAIVLADLSMSMDNVIAVAGAAKDHPLVLSIGLTVSVVSMFLAAIGVEQMLEKWPRTAWLAIGLVFLTGCKLTFEAAFASA